MDGPDAASLPTGLYPGPGLAEEPRGFERLLAHVTCTVTRGGWYEFPPGWHVGERIQPHTILFLVVDGTAVVRIADTEYPLVPGRAVLAPADVPQAVWNDGAGAVWMHTVAFNARLYDVLDMPALYGLPIEQDLDIAAFGRLVARVRRLIGELHARRPGYGLAVSAACLDLLAALWRLAVDAGTTRDAEAVVADGAAPTAETSADPARLGSARLAELARLEPVLRTIQSRYAENLTLDQLASLVHLHPAYFSTVFHRATGLPPSQYLARYRLRRARDLLLSTDHSIREIAAATGFRDPFYLSRTFRRVLGTSPSAYRKRPSGPDLP